MRVSKFFNSHNSKTSGYVLSVLNASKDLWILKEILVFRKEVFIL